MRFTPRGGRGWGGRSVSGAAQLVAKVRAAINIRFQSGDQLAVVFADRGQGFFKFKSGRITPEYNSALQEHGLRAFIGQDAARQPGDLQELMLHETAMAWVNNRVKVTRPAETWKDTEAEFGERLRSVAEFINATYDVESLCRGLPHRIAKLRNAQGYRLKS